MTPREPLDAVLARWAARHSAVRALVMIGSRLRSAGPTAGDLHADWDFQLVTRRPAQLADRAWWADTGLAAPAAYVVRATFGGVQKVTAVGEWGELDLVVIPAGGLTLLRTLWQTRLVRLLPPQHPAWRGLRDLALVQHPGWRLVHGSARWQHFFTEVGAQVADPRLGDTEAIALAEGFVCDVVWLRRKIARGEFLAAQRTLHGALAETNFRLVHELRLRRGQASLPEARRCERLLTADELVAVRVDAKPDAEALTIAVRRAAGTLRVTMQGLVGEAWRWPDAV